MASILAGMHGAVAEGVSTTRAAKLLADRLGLQVPIISGLYKILYGEPLQQCVLAVRATACAWLHVPPGAAAW